MRGAGIAFTQRAIERARARVMKRNQKSGPRLAPGIFLNQMHLGFSALHWQMIQRLWSLIKGNAVKCVKTLQQPAVLLLQTLARQLLNFPSVFGCNPKCDVATGGMIA